MSRSRAQVRVPASTSNLGPGFDCLGLALNLYNTATISRAEQARLPDSMIGRTATAFFKRFNRGEPFGFEARVEGDIPVSRGLGSSVSVRLGVLLGLAELVRESTPLSDDEILSLLIDLEGHPDNAVPSFRGGFAVCAPASGNAEDGFSYVRTRVRPELSFVTLIPDLRLSTEAARALLPAEIPFRNAVENMQRTALIAAAFGSGDYGALRGLFVDHLHQPFRQALIPGFSDILAVAREAGALGSFLSGSGSTLMAVTLEHAEAISAAMLEAARKHALPARVLVLKADNDGAQVLNPA